MKSFEKLGPFTPSLYQCAIACIMCQKTRNFAARVKAGMGKTMISLLIGGLQRNKGLDVLVVLVNKLLYEQFRFENDVYFKGDPLAVEMIEDITPEICRDKVVILDESDYAIDKFAVYFD